MYYICHAKYIIAGTYDLQPFIVYNYVESIIIIDKGILVLLYYYITHRENFSMILHARITFF